jgi:hypothetical protein
MAAAAGAGSSVKPLNSLSTRAAGGAGAGVGAAISAEAKSDTTAIDLTPKEKIKNILITAIKNNDETALRIFFKVGDISASDTSKYKELIALTDTRFNINEALDDQGTTLLHIAIEHHASINIASLLVSKGANPDQKRTGGDKLSAWDIAFNRKLLNFLPVLDNKSGREKQTITKKAIELLIAINSLPTTLAATKAAGSRTVAGDGSTGGIKKEHEDNLAELNSSLDAILTKYRKATEPTATDSDFENLYTELSAFPLLALTMNQERKTAAGEAKFVGTLAKTLFSAPTGSLFKTFIDFSNDTITPTASTIRKIIKEIRPLLPSHELVVREDNATRIVELLARLTAAEDQIRRLTAAYTAEKSAREEAERKLQDLTTKIAAAKAKKGSSATAASTAATFGSAAAGGEPGSAAAAPAVALK